MEASGGAAVRAAGAGGGSGRPGREEPRWLMHRASCQSALHKSPGLGDCVKPLRAASILPPQFPGRLRTARQTRQRLPASPPEPEPQKGSAGDLKLRRLRRRLKRGILAPVNEAPFDKTLC